MSKWIDADLVDRQIMIRRVSDEKHFADSAAEKDWWVTLCLKAIFSLPYAPYMLFKGGTSLSKGWNIISRFFGRHRPDYIAAVFLGTIAIAVCQLRK